MMYREIDSLAKFYDMELLATDPRFRGTAEITHEDGSYFKWRNAFMMETRTDKWILVFTEHFGYHLFDQRDLVSFRHFTLDGPLITELDIEEFRVPRV